LLFGLETLHIFRAYVIRLILKSIPVLASRHPDRWALQSVSDCQVRFIAL